MTSRLLINLQGGQIKVRTPTVLCSLKAMYCLTVSKIVRKVAQIFKQCVHFVRLQLHAQVLEDGVTRGHCFR